MIQQLIPTVALESKDLINEMIEHPSLFKSKNYSMKCENWLSTNVYNKKPVFMTNSGTRALELIAASIDIKTNDEIIFPSYTFVGTVNPFVQYGATPVFVDIDKDSLGIDIIHLESAISPKTKAIVVVHYNGIARHIDKIKELANTKGILLIEDNAQGFLCKYKRKYTGTFGDFSILSFNYTKNVQCGEGGALIVNNLDFMRKIEILYNLGTNKIDFEKKLVKNYEWSGMGSKFYPSQLECAMLLPQLEKSKEIIQKRIDDWEYYFDLFSEKNELFKFIELPIKLSDCKHSGHIFYIKVKENREGLISFLSAKNIQTYAHYTPLHLSIFGKQFNYFGKHNALNLSRSILRLPIYHKIKKVEIKKVVESILEYYRA